MKLIIEKLLDQKSLTQEEAREVMFEIMSGEYNDAPIAGFLIALRTKGETSTEIAGFVQAMRDKMTRIECVEGAIDMCGTGGDASGTFNISTASPPVPHISIAPSTHSIRVILSRIAWTKPAISVDVSPLVRSAIRNPAI
jgi:anthranilate phosphoribosyltransferase